MNGNGLIWIFFEGSFVMNQTVENTLITAAVLVAVNLVGIRYVQKYQRRKLWSGLLTGLFIALLGVTVMQSVMLYKQLDGQSTVHIPETLTNEQFLAKLTYTERFGDSFTMQVEDLQQLAATKQFDTLQASNEEFATMLAERIQSLNLLIADENLTTQQTNYLILYKKGLTHYADATKQFQKLIQTQNATALSSASKKLASGLTTIERAQVIINSMA